MINKKLISVLLGCCMFFMLQAQNKSEAAFFVFADHQDTAFETALIAGDVQAYGQLMQQFTKRYYKLSIPMQHSNSDYFADAAYGFARLYAKKKDYPHALRWLDTAAAKGFTEYTRLVKEGAFAVWANRKDFKKLATRIKEAGDYIAILKNGGGYEKDGIGLAPVFTYDSPTSPGLAKLRVLYNLDSVASGTGDIASILLLMRWVHHIIPKEDGPNPRRQDALSLIRYCQKNKTGLGCYGIAMVLNEACLAMGFKSRYIICKPKDSLATDGDAHVINMVFAPSLKKWLWIDAQDETWVTNSKGDLLSIEEVRLSLVKNQPLFIAPNANINDSTPVIAQNYLDYMAKNLYRFQCPLHSGWNGESAGMVNGVVPYTELIPLQQSKSANKTVTEIIGAVTLRVYKTSNAKAFWAAPF